MLRFASLVVILVSASLFYASTPASDTNSAVSSAGSITPATPLLEPRSGHSATLLPNGKVLIAGGMRRNQDFYRSAELYDPATGKFQPTGQMNIARVGHVAVLLRTGKVLVAGGWLGHDCQRFRRTLRSRNRQISASPQNDRQARPPKRHAARQRRRPHHRRRRPRRPRRSRHRGNLPRRRFAIRPAQPHAFCPYRPHHNFTFRRARPDRRWTRGHCHRRRRNF